MKNINNKRLIALDITNILDALKYELSIKQIIADEYNIKYILDYIIKKILEDDFGKIIVLSELGIYIDDKKLNSIYTNLHAIMWNLIREYIINETLHKYTTYQIETIIFNRSLHIYIRSY